MKTSLKKFYLTFNSIDSKHLLVEKEIFSILYTSTVYIKLCHWTWWYIIQSQKFNSMQIDKNDFCRCLLDSFIITVFLLSFSLSGISDRLWLLATATVFLLSLTSLVMRLVVFFLCLCLSSGGGVDEEWFWSLLWLLLIEIINDVISKKCFIFYLLSSSSVTWTTMISSESFLRLSDDIFLESFVLTSLKAANDLRKKQIC